MTDLRETNSLFTLMNNEPLSNEEIETFINSFKTFISRAEVEEVNYLRRESSRKYRQMYYLNESKRLGITLDYYLSEFT
jgi:hypothetical protein